jgi:hypothetical protein
MLIDTTEVFIVQTRAQAQPGVQALAWQDVREFDEDGPAFHWADYLRKAGDTEARVVRRWR